LFWCVGRNVASDALKMFSHLLYVIQGVYKCCAFNAICKGNTAKYFVLVFNTLYAKLIRRLFNAVISVISSVSPDASNQQGLHKNRRKRESLWDVKIKDCFFLEGITIPLMVELFFLLVWKKSFPLPPVISYPASRHKPT
jgi:hypothetical protein